MAANKHHEIWQRDSLSFEIYSRRLAEQKLKYIHFNPVNGKWILAKVDLDYYYSSARFYESGVDEFGFLNNIFEVFDGWFCCFVGHEPRRGIWLSYRRYVIRIILANSDEFKLISTPKEENAKKIKETLLSLL